MGKNNKLKLLSNENTLKEKDINTLKDGDINTLKGYKFNKSVFKPLRGMQQRKDRSPKLPKGIIRYSKNIYNNLDINKDNENTLFTQYATNGTRVLLKVLHGNQERIKAVQECMTKGYNQHKLFRRVGTHEISNIHLGCNYKFCPNCREYRRKFLRRELKEYVMQFQQPRFMTVSFKSQTKLTKDFIKKSAQEFNITRKLLKRKNYNFGNYLNIQEIKYNKKGSQIYDRRNKNLLGYHKENNWNLHYHIIYDGDYIPVKLARQLFEQSTKGESWYINVDYISKESIHNKAKALNYVTKYISKMDLDVDDYDKMIEYYNATYGIRFLKTYGFAILKKCKYQLFRKYLENLPDYRNDYLKIIEFESEIRQFMHYFGCLLYDLTMTEEENFLMHSDTNILKTYKNNYDF